MTSNVDTTSPCHNPHLYNDVYPEHLVNMEDSAAAKKDADDSNNHPRRSISNMLLNQDNTYGINGTDFTENFDPGSQNTDRAHKEDKHKDELIIQLQNENKFLRDELKIVREQIEKKTVELLLSKQEHTTAITEKRREIDGLRKQFGRETNQLRETTERLEAVIMCRNQKEIEIARLQLDYDACLEALKKAKTESGVRASDRDRRYKEARFYEDEGKRLTKDLYQLQQRNDDLNKSITMLNTQSKDEIHRLECENAALVKKITSLEDRLEKAIEEQDAESLGSLVSAPSLHLSSMSSLTDSDHDNDLLNEPRLATTRSRDEPPDSIGYKRFKVTPSLAPHCRNCGMIFGGSRSHQNKCGFHALPPLPFQVWRTQIDIPKDELERMHPDNKYWPCCDKISRNEPTGCKVLPRHDLVNPSDPED